MKLVILMYTMLDTRMKLIMCEMLAISCESCRIFAWN